MTQRTNYGALARKVRTLSRENGRWRGSCINILAAENVTSPTVRQIVASDFMHRYSEYEGHDVERRFDEGGRYTVEVERIGQRLAKELFGSRFAELRPISGHMAIMSCILAMMSPGGTSLELSGPNGGHNWDSFARTNPAVNYRPEYLPFDTDEWNVDIDGARKKIKATRPDAVVLGSSFFLFPHPTKEIREAADETGTKVLYDGAHVLGLIAGGAWPNPLRDGAHFLTGSTHKSFPGPQKGIILSDDQELLGRAMGTLYPSMLTNHHLMNVAALTYAMAEFLQFGAAYASQTVKNAVALAEALSGEGFDVIGADKGFTRSHQVLVRTSPRIRGDAAAKTLDLANIVCNKMELEKADGLRIGVSEVTRVGMRESEMREVARFIGDVLIREKDPSKVVQGVRRFTEGFRKIRFSFEDGRDAYSTLRTS
jgi:glycine hydroxymethyltransferase